MRRIRTALVQELPALDGTALRLTLLEVEYAAGAASPPHTHACAVVGYVVRGRLRSHMAGAAETTYGPNQAFYEPPNGTHLVSANASMSQPAMLLVYSLCDRDAPAEQNAPRPETEASPG